MSHASRQLHEKAQEISVATDFATKKLKVYTCNDLRRFIRTRNISFGKISLYHHRRLAFFWC